jgi:hypothetical protein
MQCTDPRFISCSFVRNASNGVAGAYCNSAGETTFVNCSFSNNSASSTGGALYNPDLGGGVAKKRIKVYNCSFAGNSATSGSAIDLGTATGNKIIMRNSIIWGNTGTPYFAFNTSNTNVSVQYCDVQGWTSTTDGNFSSDPLFASVSGDNLRIDKTSPCRNTGTNPEVQLDFYDANNNGDTDTEDAPDRDRLTRILNTTVDMGAYESNASATCCADITGNCVVDVDDLLAVVNGWGYPGAGDVAPTSSCTGDGLCKC